MNIQTETKKVITLCEGKTDSKGLLICEVQSPISGNVILQAQSVDEMGNKTVAQRMFWVAERMNGGLRLEIMTG